MWLSEQQEKDAFARAWLKEPDAFKAAVMVFGSANAGRALQISATWVLDEYVLNKKKELLENEGPEAFLPTKFEVAQMMLENHKNARNAEDKRKQLRDYAELMKFIEKPEVTGKIGSGIVAIPVGTLDAKL